MLDAAEGERFEEAAQLRDALRTVQTLHDRQQKMATAELGHRDVFGLKLGPGRRRRPGLPGPQRPRRRAHRARHRGGDRRRERGRGARGGDPAVLRAARRAAGDPRAGGAGRARGARELAVGARRPPRAHRRAAARREARPRRSREPQRRARLSDAVQPGEDGAVRRARNAAARARPAGAAAAHRMLRHLDDSGQRDGRVDGRLRRRPDAAGGVPEVPDHGAWSWRLEVRRSEPAAAKLRVPSPATVAGRLRRDARSRAAALPQAARAGRTVSRSRR